MRLSRFFGFLVGTLLTSSVFAANTKDYAAVIHFKHPGYGPQIVFQANKVLSQIDTVLDDLLSETYSSFGGAWSPEHMAETDMKVQKIKSDKLIPALAGRGITFNSFDTEVVVDIFNDGNGNSWQFDLTPIRSMLDGLSAIQNVGSPQQIIRDAINTVNTVLPSGVDARQLKKFLRATKVSLLSEHDLAEWTTLNIANTSDSHSLLQSFVVLHNQLIKGLQAALVIAEQDHYGALSQKERIELLDEVFRRIYFDVYVPFYQFTYGDIKLFNDNTLKFQYNGQVREYYFPKLNLYTVNLKNASVSDLNSAYNMYVALYRVKMWMGDWAVTGNAPVDVTSPLQTRSVALLPKVSHQ